MFDIWKAYSNMSTTLQWQQLLTIKDAKKDQKFKSVQEAINFFDLYIMLYYYSPLWKKIQIASVFPEKKKETDTSILQKKYFYLFKLFTFCQVESTNFNVFDYIYNIK